eukprot:TRINITY_DN444_c0_g2_i1.p1 TRINITY_DN444_c0_g2~~TRINITY_DN444_c0_g2_i1.p1  ORF type:complete len:326 (+),score=88.97 TRINITY_DN444_c0_g2_i1:247-1224(+)
MTIPRRLMTFQKIFARNSVGRSERKRRKRQRKTTEKKEKGGRSGCPYFMDGKRAQAVGMKLGALKLKRPRDFERMRSWVLKLSTASLASLRADAVPENPDYPSIMGDLIGNIINAVPDETEQATILESWDGKHFDAAERPDKFWLVMRLVPDAKKRCEAWKLKVTADQEIEFYGKYVKVLLTCKDAITTNESLHKFFGLMIRFGNFMNVKKKDKARAFELKSLEAIMGCKSRDSQTLLAYIVKFARLHHPPLLEWVNDLEYLKAAARSATAVRDRETEIKSFFDKVKAMKQFVGENSTWSSHDYDVDDVEAIKKRKSTELTWPLV